MPFLIMFIIFVLIPVVELSVLIRVGEVLGSWNTVALVILTAVVGVSLVRSQGLSTLMSVQKKLAAGEAPGQEIVEGMMLAMAGILLLIPGFVTDLIGLILLTPITRARWRVISISGCSSRWLPVLSSEPVPTPLSRHIKEARAVMCSKVNLSARPTLPISVLRAISWVGRAISWKKIALSEVKTALSRRIRKTKTMIGPVAGDQHKH